MGWVADVNSAVIAIDDETVARVIYDAEGNEGGPYFTAVKGGRVIGGSSLSWVLARLTD
jgi:hypothetical protein